MQPQEAPLHPHGLGEHRPPPGLLPLPPAPMLLTPSTACPDSPRCPVTKPPVPRAPRAPLLPDRAHLSGGPGLPKLQLCTRATLTPESPSSLNPQHPQGAGVLPHPEVRELHPRDAAQGHVACDRIGFKFKLDPNPRIGLREAAARCLLPPAGPREHLALLARKRRARRLFLLSARAALCLSQPSKFILAARLADPTLHASFLRAPSCTAFC